MVFILLIAFSLVVAVSSVFLVNERVKGEKLQQKLCGVNLATYWGVAFVWDFLVSTFSKTEVVITLLYFRGLLDYGARHIGLRCHHICIWIASFCGSSECFRYIRSGAALCVSYKQ